MLTKCSLLLIWIILKPCRRALTPAVVLSGGDVHGSLNKKFPRWCCGGSRAPEEPAEGDLVPTRLDLMLNILFTPYGCL